MVTRRPPHLLDTLTDLFRPGPALPLGGSLVALFLILAASAAEPPPSGVALSPIASWPGYSRGSAESVAMTETHAFVATPAGVQVFDVTPISGPVQVGAVDIQAWLPKVVVSGSYAFVASSESGLQLLDIRDPANPRRLGGHGIGGVVDLAVSGTRVVVANGFEGLVVSDWAEGTNLVRRGVYPNREGFWINRVALADHLAFVCGPQSGIEIIDLADSAHPVRVGQIEVAGPLAQIAADGKYVFAASTLSFEDGPRLRVFDVADAARPVALGNRPIADVVSSLVLAEDHAYLTDLEGLKILDRRDPANLVPLPGVPSSSRAAAQSRLMGKWIPRALWRGVTVSSGRAWVAAGTRGLLAFDLQTRPAPVRTGAVETAGRAMEMVLDGHLAYLADETAGLKVVDLTQPDRPTTLGHLPLPQSGTRVAVNRKHAYLAYYEPWGDVLPPPQGGLYIVDITAPGQPLLVGQYAPGHGIADVIVSDSHAFVAYYGERDPNVDGGLPTSGLRVLDVRDPGRPVLMGQCAIEGWTSAMALEGDHVYLANGSSLHIVDVRDPARPVKVGTYQALGSVAQVAVQGPLAVVGVGRGPGPGNEHEPGLHLLDVRDPRNPVRLGRYQPWSGDSTAGLTPYPPVLSGIDLSGLLIRIVGDRIFAVFDESSFPDFYLPSGIRSELHVLDIRDPAHPIRLNGSGQLLDHRPTDLAVVGNRIVTASGDLGLRFWEYREVPRLLGIRSDTGGRVTLHFAANEADPSHFRILSASSLAPTVRWTAASTDGPIVRRADGSYEALLASSDQAPRLTVPESSKFYRVEGPANPAVNRLSP